MNQADPPHTTDDRSGSGPRPLRILLAEDNVASQKLTARILKKRGHTVEAVSNGKEALAALEREHFDLVLMDVQMPQMDGLATAAAIRDRERTTGGHVPIVALSAYAMPGDPERCLAAGMDGHIAKPLRPERLFATIAEHIAATSEEPGAPCDGSPTEQPTAPAFDAETVLADLDGDRELLLELIQIFHSQADEMIAAIRDAQDRADGNALERSAHKLKGSVGAFEAKDAVAVALRLELMGREGDLEGSKRCFVELEREVNRLRDSLRVFEESTS